ncbi:hypothetical protein BGX28_000667 [Mortierella sp. GBA30]|nr:hypothetical protein BGX28_000667 [Mortierella sp. GBA30]
MSSSTPSASSDPSFRDPSLSATCATTSSDSIIRPSSPSLHIHPWTRPSPLHPRRPLPEHWIHPTSTTTTTTGNTNSSSSAPSSPSASIPVPFMSTSLHAHSIAYNHTRQHVSHSAPCSPLPARRRRLQQLVFASGAVGAASALGHVFGRPLQAKDTIPCSLQNCTQLQKELQHSLIQQAQSPSHTFQQQCSVHKRFRLFRQKPRRCLVHSSPASPSYILPPTTVHPLVVRPDKILLDPFDEPAPNTSWRQSLTSSISASSRLSSSTVSLAMSTSSYTLGSDGESNNSNVSYSPKKSKKQLKKEKQQQRCLCYLDASLDHRHQQQQRAELTQQIKVHSQPQLSSSPSSWYPKHQKESSRLRRIWNDSTIFHWSKPSGTSRRWQQHQQQVQQHQEDQQLSYHHSQQHSAPHGRTESTFEHRKTIPEGGVPMRNSLSGTDISDEGNHSLSDVNDEDDCESCRTTTTSLAENSQHRVSFQEHFGSATRNPRSKDDIKAISRHQAEMSQQHDGAEGQGRPPMASFRNGDDDDDDDDEDWDIQSDSGAPSSSRMYSAGVREPSSYSTVTLPLSPANNRGYHKKPSNANLNTLRSRQRCLSLPADTVPPGFLKMSSTPSENWDEDFDIGAADINVPTSVAETQFSLQMDIYNIKDFALHIEDLKTLRASLRMASSSVKATHPKKHQDLSMLFQRDWEQADVIIDLGEIAQTSNATLSHPGPAHAAGPHLPLSSKVSDPSIGKSSSHRQLRRPALSTTAPAAASPIASSSFKAKSRSVSQSSNLTGYTIVVSESDSGSCASSRASSGLTIDVETATSSLDKARRQSGGPFKGSNSSPAGLGSCSTPVTPLPSGLRSYAEDIDNYDDDDGENDYVIESPVIGRNSAEDDVISGARWPVHCKEDSSATVKAIPIQSAANGVQAEIEASLRRYQKYSHHSKKRSGGRRAMLHEEDEDDEAEEEEEDDGYESYGHGYGDGSSVGVVTPIPSDRHMQVLKDILMEGLGSDVARQYMFKQGEQDHVRFSVEVIPGLLGHLKGLQQRLGKQLMELQQLTVLV